jgi:hypothetical protein
VVGTLQIQTALWEYDIRMGFELKASHLLGRCCTTWAMLQSIFALAVFQIEAHFYAKANPDWMTPE